MKTQTITNRPKSPCKSTAKIYLAGGLNVMSAPGGGEVQMMATAAALSRIGVRAKLWRPWEHRFARGDCLHLFGSLPEHLATIEAARRQGVRVVLSTIAWFDLASYWREPGPLSSRIAAVGRYLLRANWPSMPSWRRQLYHSVDMLLPNSNSEADQLMRLFQVPANRIHIVPNGSDPRFAVANAGQFVRKYKLRDFVLSIGRIEPRKNQLGLIRALKDTDLNLVILGRPMPGCETYHEACLNEAGPNVHFVDHIDHKASMLASAYGACRCLALTSWFETPGLVALEAAMSGVPLVLPKGGSAHEYFGNQAQYVSPDNLTEIRDAVCTAFNTERDEHLALRVQRHFTWESVARITRRAYDNQSTI